MLAGELGDLARAEQELALVVALDEAIGNPDLESDRAALAQVRALRGNRSPWTKRLARWIGQ